MSHSEVIDLTETDEENVPVQVIASSRKRGHTDDDEIIANVLVNIRRTVSPVGEDGQSMRKTEELRRENETLRQENEKLRREIDDIRIEKEKYQEEYKRLKTDHDATLTSAKESSAKLKSLLEQVQPLASSISSVCQRFLEQQHVPQQYVPQEQVMPLPPLYPPMQTQKRGHYFVFLKDGKSVAYYFGYRNLSVGDMSLKSYVMKEHAPEGHYYMPSRCTTRLSYLGPKYMPYPSNITNLPVYFLGEQLDTPPIRLEKEMMDEQVSLQGIPYT